MGNLQSCEERTRDAEKDERIVAGTLQGAKECNIGSAKHFDNADEASRRILAGSEFSNINTENSKQVLDQVIEKYWWLLPVRELIMDHGNEFGADRVHEDGSWNRGFNEFINWYSITIDLMEAWSLKDLRLQIWHLEKDAA